MKRLSYAIVALALAIPAFASYEDQSYLSYDSGDTIVVQGIDNREIEVGVNSPVFAGDQVVTGRRGRVEIRLSDGNVVALDNRTSVLFHAMQGGYESEDQQTIAELLRGKLIVQHVDDDYVPVRVDTRSATYHSIDESILSISTDGYRDEVSVFGGLVEVRTREGSYRLRAGERIFVGENGIYESSGLARDGMDDFERWFIRRTDDNRGYSARYLEGRHSYAEPMLDVYGSWVYVQDYGEWVWRPRVSVGWKPYYDGYWRRGRTGALVWVSNEPWGWVPYHYGRWAFSSFHGWVWVPGSVYAPAWVYWAYGPSWVGWVPWGYYDYHTPYHGWLHRPRRTVRVGVGFGFWGQVHVSDRDLNHWVVVGPDHLVSTRVDRAALTTDRIRERLQRDGNRATFTDTPARFTRDELKNPADAVRTISRRAPGEGTGNERSGSEVVDATSFFRRDPDLSTSLRDRLTRTNGDDASDSTVRTVGGGDRSPGGTISRGDREPGSGTVTRPGAAAGSATPGERPATRTITRDRTPSRTPRTPVIERGQSSDEVKPDTTERVTPERRTTTPIRLDRSPSRGADDESTVSPRTEPNRSGSTSWRERSLERSATDRSPSPTRTRESSSERSSTDRNWRETPVPGRVIDSIGGARLVPRGSTDRSGSVDRGRTDSSSSSRSPSTTRTRTITPRSSAGTTSSSPTRRDSSSRRSSVSRDGSSSGSSSGRVTTRPRSSSGSSSGRVTTSPRSSSSSSSKSRATTSSRSSSSSSSAKSGSSSRSSSSSRGTVSRSKPDDR